MPEAFDVRVAGEQVDRLLADLGGLADASAVAKAEELVRTLVGLYGAGLERVMEIVTETDAAEALHLLTVDDLVSGLLIVHGLHPLTTAERVQNAIDGVRPRLEDVELLGAEDGVARIRLAGAGKGCSSARIVETIERAIASAAPEISAVEVAAERPLLQIGPRPSGPALDVTGR